ncbi:restriction endonuclease subunit S domain-containing protein [Terriglobus aquaticus]|uniref:Type I restriction modification DNA specificity domain-containing protein n=1 Tax=Terriglobus aquaticus TaxID=940139 RepID=A0ABW9KM73_9BACT|nr:hypothetical protein [Terriglobus aquaticus]
MAHFGVRRLTELDNGFVLAPERYDPRKEDTRLKDDDGVRLFDIVDFPRELIPKGTSIKGWRVFDTGHAADGFLKIDDSSVLQEKPGSAKKLIQPGDLIISRLRSYLKQIAWIDEGVEAEDIHPCVSTEFFVLRPKSKDSIAYLVPFLLSGVVQAVLAASQEGGHHPRFQEKVLRDLVVPRAVYEQRAALAQKVESSIEKRRAGERQMLVLADLIKGILGR